MATKNKYFTCCCKPEEHADLPIGKFYSIKGGIYKDLGHLPICKDCFDNMLTEFEVQLHSRRLALRRMCMLFDLYYKPDLLKDVENAVGVYIRTLNMKQNIGKHFDDSIAEGEVNAIMGVVNPITEDEISEATVDRRLVDRWGAGLQPIEYEDLEAHYDYLKSANPNCDSNQQIFIIDLCYIKMQQMRAIREGKTDDHIKLTKSYRETFQQAGLKTVNENANEEEAVFGITTATIERYTPAEYYRNKKLYRDMDGFGDYVDRFIIRPLRNITLGSKDRDAEFHVEGDDENDLVGDNDE